MLTMKYSGGAVIFQSEMQHQQQPYWGMQQCAYNRYIMVTLTFSKKMCGISFIKYPLYHLPDRNISAQ